MVDLKESSSRVKKVAIFMAIIHVLNESGLNIVDVYEVVENIKIQVEENARKQGVKIVLNSVKNIKSN